jgi:hypothetical protein
MLLLVSMVFAFVPLARATSTTEQTAYSVVTHGTAGVGPYYVTANFTNPVVIGDVITAECVSGWNAVPIASITSTEGTLVSQIGGTFFGGYNYLEIASIAVTTATTVSVTCTTPSAYNDPRMSLAIQEVNGISPTASATSPGSAGSTNSPHTTNSLSYADGAFLVAVYGQENGSTWTQGAGFTITLGSDGTSLGQNGEYETPSNSGTTNFPMTLSLPEDWGGIAAVFPITSTPTGNFWIYNAQSGGTYPIGDFNNSYVMVSYPSAAPSYYPTSGSLTNPTNIGSYGSSLITLWVGASNITATWFSTMIPNASHGATNKMYLPPSMPTFFTLAVTDLTGNFPGGTEVYIRQGNGTSDTFSSGTLDSSDTYPVWLVPGTYNVELENGVYDYQTTVAFPSVSGTVSLQILKVTHLITCGPTCSVSYGLGIDPTHQELVFAFADTTNSTTQLTYALWKQNISGQFELPLNATHAGCVSSGGSVTCNWLTVPSCNTNHCPGFFVDDAIDCHTDGCNDTMSSQLYFKISYTDMFGSSIQISFPMIAGQLFSSVPGISGGLLGWDIAFPSTTLLSFFSLVILLVVAAVFGAYSAKFGVIVDTVLAGAFVAAGWLPESMSAVILFAGAIAVTSFMAYLQEGR